MNRILTKPAQPGFSVSLVEAERCYNCGHVVPSVKVETPASIVFICVECWDSINRTLKLKDAWA